MLLLAFFMTFSLLQFLYKKCYQSGHQRAPWLLSSRVMSTFSIKSHQYTITLCTPGHLQISWDVFAKKSADILSFRNSFTTISIVNQSTFFVQCVKARPRNRPSSRLPVLGHKKPRRSWDCWVGSVV